MYLPAPRRSSLPYDDGMPPHRPFHVGGLDASDDVTETSHHHRPEQSYVILWIVGAAVLGIMGTFAGMMAFLIRTAWAF